MTFHVQNAQIGSFPFLSAGNKWDYGGYSSDAFTSVDFNTFRATNIITAQPWANVGTRRFNSYEIGPIDTQVLLMVIQHLLPHKRWRSKNNMKLHEVMITLQLQLVG